MKNKVKKLHNKKKNIYERNKTHRKVYNNEKSKHDMLIWWKKH